MECDGKKSGCWCDLDWFCRHGGLARVLDGTQQYGDPFCYSLPFVVRRRYWFPKLRAWWTKQPIKFGLVEFVGVKEVMRSCQYRAMRAAMRGSGWGILSTRIKDGKARTIEICKRGSIA